MVPITFTSTKRPGSSRSQPSKWVSVAPCTTWVISPKENARSTTDSSRMSPPTPLDAVREGGEELRRRLVAPAKVQHHRVRIAARRQQRPDHVAHDETRAPGYQHPHRVRPPSASFSAREPYPTGLAASRPRASPQAAPGPGARFPGKCPDSSFCVDSRLCGNDGNQAGRHKSSFPRTNVIPAKAGTGIHPSRAGRVASAGSAGIICPWHPARDARPRRVAAAAGIAQDSRERAPGVRAR